MERVTVISLGAGVQSSTLFLMACRGEITPKPDFAVFADTQAEPDPVYRHLEFLQREGHAAGIPIYITTGGDLGSDVYDFIDGYRERSPSIPFFVKKKDLDKEGRLFRQCTERYKIRPVRKEIRKHIGKIYPSCVELWLGISTDEITRVKPSDVKYIEHRWPLIELDMSRQDCLDWYNGKDYPTPPRSACYFCPYRKDKEWLWLKENDPEAFKQAVIFDERIRNQPKLDGQIFVHRSLVPLSEVDFTKPRPDTGFDEDCVGMCGV
jgi:hypothetical protein